MKQYYIIIVLLIIVFIAYSPDITAQKAELKIIDKETSESCAFSMILFAAHI